MSVEVMARVAVAGLAIAACRGSQQPAPPPEPRPVPSATAMPPPSPAIKPASDAYVQPISPTTIIQVQFAPDSLSGSRLAWVVAVRADTSWFARRLDIETIELKPGFFGWKYRTGPYEYRLAFNGRHHLVIDETEIDLRQHTMVFVSLDRRTGRANEVRPGAFVSFVSATPRTRAEYDRLIAALPGLTEFANAVR